jgi:hypothetical protein
MRLRLEKCWRLQSAMWVTMLGVAEACMRLARGGVGDVCFLRWVPVVWFVGCVVQKDGRTPLFDASQSGHVEAVRALLVAGTAVNQAEVSGSCVGLGMARLWRSYLSVCEDCDRQRSRVCVCGLEHASETGAQVGVS